MTATSKTKPSTKKSAATGRANGDRSAKNGKISSATTGRSGAQAGSNTDTFTIPGLAAGDAAETASILQRRLESLIDLTLTLKHVHWNVVGNGFIGVHEMLDPQYEAVALMVDATAERIAAMGASPNGLAGSLVKHRAWDDYALDRAVVPQHLLALDDAYSGVIASHRDAVRRIGDLDPVTEDMLIGQLGRLEGFQWFIRAHLENGDGVMATGGPSAAARRRN